jgi:predicted aldo/keto reductase-like oxidoreductase
MTMQYRKFGKLDWKGSALGFGAMRLPVIDRNPVNVDEPEAIRMFRYAIDHGVNYIDSAYGYHGGKSEVAVGKALKDGYRQKVRVATKLPSWLVQSPQDYDRFLNEQLERLQTGKIDYYLLHGLSKERWAKLRDLGVLRWAEGAMSDGRIGGLGFSFHDEFSAFKEIIDAYDNWTLCQMQYNFMDVNYQAGNRGLKYAAAKGLAVVIMEPLRGGRLSRKPPESVVKLWSSSPKKHTPAEWALLWVWNHPEVSVVLSGMSAMEQVIENVASADLSGPGTLTADDLALIDRVREVYRASSPIPCTGCRYCMPCLNGVEIPRIFEIYNDAIMYDDPSTARFFYRGPNGLKEEQRAEQCIECETCVETCPQNIQIPEWLKKAHELLGPPKKS